jgi:very-short-patch-repair endonuclease
MWLLLRSRRLAGYKFRRQVPIGAYIADFLTYTGRLIIELDGSQHHLSAYDADRDAWLQSQDFRLLRLWNSDLADRDAVLSAIFAILEPTP